jgi:hypothetical protein
MLRRDVLPNLFTQEENDMTTVLTTSKRIAGDLIDPPADAATLVSAPDELAALGARIETAASALVEQANANAAIVAQHDYELDAARAAAAPSIEAVQAALPALKAHEEATASGLARAREVAALRGVPPQQLNELERLIQEADAAPVIRHAEEGVKELTTDLLAAPPKIRGLLAGRVGNVVRQLEPVPGRLPVFRQRYRDLAGLIERLRLAPPITGPAWSPQPPPASPYTGAPADPGGR